MTFQDAGPSGIPGTAITKPSLNGQENRSTLYYMDGFINTDLRGPIYGVLPIIDLVDQFKVQSHNDKVDYGGVTGGVVNVASKSGTNQYHGDAWEFLRNDVFDARNSFTEPTSPAAYRQNEFGATLGGPILKNKLFFYGGYEGWRYRKPSQSFQYVPTAAELNGDFSASKINQNIFNPFSAHMDAQGRLVRDPFAGNMIPSNMISTPMQTLFQTYVQRPNFTPTATNSNNYLENFSTLDNANNWQVRGDYTIGNNDTAFFRWSQMRIHHLEAVPGANELRPSDYVANNMGGGWNHIFSPTLVLDVRAGGLSKPVTFNQAAANAGISPLTQAGFNGLNTWGGMFVDLASPWLTSDLGNRGDSIRDNPDWSINANLNWIKGNHNIQAGFQYIYVARDQINTFQQFVFSNQQTADTLNQGTTGASLASALLGLPTTFTGQLPAYGEVHFAAPAWALYVQDQWKVRPKLTLNYGIRLDALLHIHNIDTNRLSNALDIPNGKWIIGGTSLPPACNQSNQNPCLPGDGLSSVPYSDHIVSAGQQYFMPQSIYDNWGPRIGAAYQLTSNTVLRGGYGLYWDALPARSQYSQNDIEGASWPWTTGFSGSANAVGQPVQLITDLVGNFPNPVPAASPWATVSGSTYVDSPNLKDGYSQQWNFGVEHQFSNNWMVSASYVGSKNGRLAYTGYANAAPTPSPNGTPASTIDALRAMPFMPAIAHYTESIGSSHYNAFHAKVEKRFSNGFQTLLSYTWSRSIDNTSGYFGVEDGSGQRGVQNFFDPSSNQAASGFDIPQYLTWFTVYQLPAGPGKRWFTSGPASYALGGWRLSSIFSIRSGQPFNLGVNGDVANIGGTGPALSSYARPNVIGDPVPSNQTAGMWYNPAAFVAPAGTFGNFGRNYLRSSSVWDADVSLIKDTPLGDWEGKSVEFRFETFNLFNHVNLGVPGTTIGQSSAGQITSQVVAPRQLQLALKFIF